jgi:glutathione synthase/RimK-type ligase-like ATP-grasp enzyme
MGKLGWEEAVLKSLSGQSGYHCHKIQRTTPEDWSEVAGAIPTEAALLQAFQPDISRYSETVFVFFLGEYSHSVRRVIAQGEWRANSRFGARPEAYSPSPGVVEQARRVLQAAPGTSPPLYARVDGIVKDDGSFTLMELELIEPALYLETDPAAAERFATAIETALATPQAL